MPPTLWWVPVLRIDLNFISHSNRDFIHIVILGGMKAGGLPHLNSYELCSPNFPKNKLLKIFPKVSPQSFPKNFPKFQTKNLCKVSQLWLQFHPKKAKFFLRLAWPTGPRRPWLWRNLQARPRWFRGKNIRWVDLCKKKTEAVGKMGSFFFFLIFVLPGDLFFFENWVGVYYSEVNINLYMI